MLDVGCWFKRRAERKLNNIQDPTTPD